MTAPLGFEPHDVLTMTLSLPVRALRFEGKSIFVLSGLIEQVESLPGVVAAAMGQNVPFDGTEWDSSFHFTGTPDSPPGHEPSAKVNISYTQIISRSFQCQFCAAGIWGEDIFGRPRSIIIDDLFARRYFPNENPVGHHIDDNQTLEKNPPAVNRHWGCAARAERCAGGRVRPAESSPNVFFRGPDAVGGKQFTGPDSGSRSHDAGGGGCQGSAADRSRSAGGLHLDDAKEHRRKPGYASSPHGPPRLVCRSRSHPGERRPLWGDGVERDPTDTRIRNSARSRRGPTRKCSNSLSDAACCWWESVSLSVCWELSGPVAP